MRTTPRQIVGRLRIPALIVKLVAAQVMLSGNEGCGTKEQQQTLQSPVQALGSVYKHGDGTVEAELVLISTIDKQHRFIDTASSADVIVDGKAISLTKDATRSGRWAATSADDARLVLEDGATYLFRFALEDSALAGDRSGGEFSGQVAAVVQGSAPAPPEGTLYVGHPVDLTFAPAIGGSKRGLLRITSPSGELVYNNFDTSQPQFDGSKHAGLLTGTKRTIPGTVFSEAGDYTVTLYTMNYAAGLDPHLSPDLGVFSGFLAGQAAEISLAVQAIE